MEMRDDMESLEALLHDLDCTVAYLRGRFLVVASSPLLADTIRSRLVDCGWTGPKVDVETES
jgi:hypothetical protein